MTLSQGQMIHNRYRIARRLGQGGFGAVYRVWDLSLNKAAALKENLDTSPEAQHQFQHEAQILANLSHPNLPRVTDHFFVVGLGQYLVMDYVEGDDLQTVSNKTGHPLSEAQVLPWIEQVCDALEYLHTQNPPIIHRDIKPANIRITPQGKAVLVDFGISKIYDPQLKTTVGARAITPGYSPPEQYGQGKTDQRSDVYSLGATLYTLLTGHEPPESVERLANGVQLAPPRQFAPTLTPAVENAILQACEPTTTRRLTSVHAFRQALHAPISTPQVLPLPMQPAATPSLPDKTMMLPSTSPSAAVKASRLSPKLISALAAGGVLMVVVITLALIAGGANKAAAPRATLTPSDTIAPASAASPEPLTPKGALLRTNTPPRLTATPRPPTATSLPSGVLLIDDFASAAASKNLGWDTEGGSGYAYTWSDGNLVIANKDSNTVVWNEPSASYTDFGVEIEAQPTSTYAEYGIIFRNDTDADSYYLFGINTNGEYFLWKYFKGARATRIINSTASPYIKSGQVKNTLALVAAGDTFDLLINGFLVKTVKDNAISRGKVGIYAGTRDNPAEVAYNRFTLLDADKAKAEWNVSAAAASSPPTTAAPPAATAAPVRSGKTTITVGNSFPNTCRIVLWGPADVTIDAGNGQSIVREVAPGTYGWRAFIGGAETGQTNNLVVKSGARCSFFCDSAQKSIRWGCN